MFDECPQLMCIATSFCMGTCSTEAIPLVPLPRAWDGWNAWDKACIDRFVSFASSGPLLIKFCFSAIGAVQGLVSGKTAARARVESLVCSIGTSPIPSAGREGEKGRKE